MKRLLCVAIALVCAATLQAQEEEKDVTKFLGIPVDGTKAEMIEKLKAKGFTPTTWDKDVLEGEFNGTDVYIGVVTNNNKVYRIGITDKNARSKTGIKNRFNILCRQFEHNPKYTSMIDEDQTIPEDEDISYEITVNDKQYQAVYYQHVKLDSITIYNEAKQSLLSKYTQEQLDNPTKDILFEIQMEYYSKKAGDLFTNLNIFNKVVWFTISEYSEGYRIIMFYENKNNEADGEDL